jgi:hypothetical protein
MKELTIFAFNEGGKLGGVGIGRGPHKIEIDNATHRYVFSRGSIRVHVLIIVGRVTEAEALELATNFVEGRSKRINFNDLDRTEDETAGDGELQYS